MKFCTMNVLLLTVVILTFIVSMVFIYNVRIEGMRVKYDCPTSLDTTSEGIYKLSYENNKKPQKFFYSIDDYIKLVNWQKKNEIACPVLSLNSEQSNIQPASLDPIEDEKVQQLLDANRDNDGYNTNMYPGFDPQNLYVGTKTPLDVMHDMEERKKISGNPMDTNWGGTEYTNKLVKSGYYVDNIRQ